MSKKWYSKEKLAVAWRFSMLVLSMILKDIHFEKLMKKLIVKTYMKTVSHTTLNSTHLDAMEMVLMNDDYVKIRQTSKL